MAAVGLGLFGSSVASTKERAMLYLFSLAAKNIVRFFRAIRL